MSYSSINRFQTQSDNGWYSLLPVMKIQICVPLMELGVFSHERRIIGLTIYCGKAAHDFLLRHHYSYINFGQCSAWTRYCLCRAHWWANILGGQRYYADG